MPKLLTKPMVHRSTVAPGSGSTTSCNLESSFPRSSSLVDRQIELRPVLVCTRGRPRSSCRFRRSARLYKSSVVYHLHQSLRLPFHTETILSKPPSRSRENVSPPQNEKTPSSRIIEHPRVTRMSHLSEAGTAPHSLTK